MTLHSVDVEKLDEEAVVKSFYSGLQPVTLQSICMKNPVKKMPAACDLLQQQMAHFDTAKEVNKLSQPAASAADASDVVSAIVSCDLVRLCMF